MAFFRKWRISLSKHKKLGEEWGLATSLKDFSETQDQEDEENTTVFNLKYLGCTKIELERSENATSKAIKSVISSAKSAKRKSQRVQVNVSPKGIEMLDESGVSMLRVSIYKISYCSADGKHDNVFAFIGSEDGVEKDDQLSCHVYGCAKRKIAHDVTLSLARCFETAYKIWRHTTERKKYQEEMKVRCQKNYTVENGSQLLEKGDKIFVEEEDMNSDTGHNLLIDLTPEIIPKIYEKDHREYLQNTWVSFDDEKNEIDRFCATNNNWQQQPLVF